MTFHDFISSVSSDFEQCFFCGNVKTILIDISPTHFVLYWTNCERESEVQVETKVVNNFHFHSPFLHLNHIQHDETQNKQIRWI